MFSCCFFLLAISPCLFSSLLLLFCFHGFLDCFRHMLFVCLLSSVVVAFLLSCCSFLVLIDCFCCAHLSLCWCVVINSFCFLSLSHVLFVRHIDAGFESSSQRSRLHVA
jgi:hypothetical protein